MGAIVDLKKIIEAEDDNYISVSDFIDLIANHTGNTLNEVVGYLGRYCGIRQYDIRIYCKNDISGYYNEFHLSDLIIKQDYTDDYRLYRINELKTDDEFIISYFYKKDILNAEYIKLLNLHNDILSLPNELDKSMPSMAIGTSVNPMAAHSEPKTNDELIKELAASNAKIKQQEQDINKLNDQLNEQTAIPTDKHLYDWQAMNKNQYPPELHLAMGIWKEYYQVHDIEHITQFNTGKFNKITNSLKLRDGNLKDRIRTLLTPLEPKARAPALIKALRSINIIHTDKLSQD
ncbi:hypothetical protein ACQKC9_00280 [Psychrobacter sp. NPDC078409]|uniref:hypothetical protein n=1 Tax=Psychrobacter sp. NPDC078409 TaxID=3390660 RepID=UPI003D02D519